MGVTERAEAQNDRRSNFDSATHPLGSLNKSLTISEPQFPHPSPSTETLQSSEERKMDEGLSIRPKTQ